MSSEKTIQNALHGWRLSRGHSFIAPNVRMPSGEMDLISVSRAGFVYEHEIKISRADFKADFNHKEEKHVWMRDAKNLKGECERHLQLRLKYTLKEIRHCANYFIYVCPENLIKVEEIPDHAGLCYWLPNTQNYQGWQRYGRIEAIKEPPRLHCEKVTTARMEKLAISMMYKYWDLRLNKSEISVAEV